MYSSLFIDSAFIYHPSTFLVSFGSLYQDKSSCSPSHFLLEIFVGSTLEWRNKMFPHKMFVYLTLTANPVVCDVRVAGSCCNIVDSGVNWFISPLLPHLPTAALQHCHCGPLCKLSPHQLTPQTASVWSHNIILPIWGDVSRNARKMQRTDGAITNVFKPPLELQWEMKAYSDTKR